MTVYFWGNKDAELAAIQRKLIAEMQEIDMRTLLIKMCCEDPISPIIVERNLKGHFSSEDKVSWFAMQRSFELSSEKDKAELLELLHDEAYSSQRSDIYRCLGSICGNTNDKELCNLLIRVIDITRDERTIVSILSRLQNVKKDDSINIEPIKKHLKEGNSDIILAAIRALAHTNDSEVEDLLLEEFKYANSNLKTTICITLESVGAEKAIPVLQKAYKRTRDQGLRMHIDDALAKISARHSRIS